MSKEARRRQLQYRADNRGTREMCILLGDFVREHIDQWTVDDLDDLDVLLSQGDPDLYDWVAGRSSPPQDLMRNPMPPASGAMSGVLDAWMTLLPNKPDKGQ